MSFKKGKINIIDIVMVLIIIFLILGAYLKFNVINKNNTTASSETKTMKYQLKIKNIRQPSVNAVRIEDKFYDDKTGMYIGKVVNKQVENATGYIMMNNGEYVEREVPNRYNMILTIEAPVVEKNDGYYAGGKIELKRQSEIKIKSKKIEMITVVYDIL